jgi:hypothetical protein
MKFPNSGDYASATQTFNFMNTLGTLTVWLKAPTTTTAALAEITGTFTQYLYVAYPGTGDVSYVDGTGFVNYGSGGFSTSTWIHVALRRSSNTVLNIMINGSTTGTDAVDHSSDTSGVVELGSLSVASGASLCQCRMWNTNLSDAEITTEMNSATHVKTANLFADWPMANGTDTSDASGNGYTLTLNGTPTTDSGNPSQGISAAQEYPAMFASLLSGGIVGVNHLRT